MDIALRNRLRMMGFSQDEIEEIEDEVEAIADEKEIGIEDAEEVIIPKHYRGRRFNDAAG